MPKDNPTDPRKNFVPRRLPYLLGAVMLVIYWFTLNHWVTLLNLGQVAASHLGQQSGAPGRSQEMDRPRLAH